jgi:TM2 domain-containing membrane protein YozV
MTTTNKNSRLTDSQRMLIEQRINNEKPSEGTAYLFCIFWGLLGAHRFYLGHIVSGVLMLALTLFSFIIAMSLVALIGSSAIFLMVLPWVWAIIDLFLIKSLVKKKIVALRTKITTEITN